MTREVFRNDHLEGVYESVRADRRYAELKLENAVLREALIEIIEAGGTALHVMFVAGGEPKWRLPEERERLIALSEAIRAAFKNISGWDV